MKRRYKVLLWLAGGFLFLLAALTILITQTKFLEKQVNLILKGLLEKEYPLRITIADISGSVISGMRLTGLQVDYTEAGYEYRLLTVDTIVVDYSPSDLWNKRWILKSVTLQNPKIELRQTKEGRWLLPRFKPAGGIRKSGFFDFQIEELKLNGGSGVLLAAADTFSFDSLFLAGKLVKDSQGWQVSLPQSSFKYVEDSLSVRSLQAGFLVKEKNIEFDTLSLASNWGDFELKGEVEINSNPEFDLSVDAGGVILEYLSRLLPEVELAGTVDLKGEVSGNLKSFGGDTQINGIFFERDLEQVNAKWAYQNQELRLDRLDGKIFRAPLQGSGKLLFKYDPPRYELNCQVQNLDLAQIIKSDLHSDFTGRVDLKGKGFSDREMQLSLLVDLSRGKLDRYDFDSARGGLEVDFNRIIFQPGFVGHYKHTSGIFSGSLEYKGNIDIAGQAELGDLTDFWGKTFLKEIAGRGKADVRVSGLTEDFDVGGTFHSDSAWVYKLYSSDLDAKFDLKTYVTNQQGTVQADVRKGEAWGIPYDSLLGTFTVDSYYVRFDTAYGGNPYASLTFKGDIDAAPEIKPLKIYDGQISYRGIPFTTGPDTLLIDVRPDDYRFRQAKLYNGKGNLSLSGTVSYENDLNLKVRFQGVEIHPWFELFLPGRQIEGSFTAESDLKGNFDSPGISLSGRIDGLSYSEIDLGQFFGSVSYADSVLSLDSLTLASPDWNYSWKGNLPVNLSFTDTSSHRLLDLPQEINFRGEGNKFSVIHLFLPDIEYMTGKFHSEIKLTGTPLKPQLNGSLNLQNGELKIDQLKDPLQHLTMDIQMENDRIYFRQLNAEVSGKALAEGSGSFLGLFKKGVSKGQLSVTGQMQVKGLNSFIYDLNVTGRNSPFVYEYMEVSGLTDFDLKIAGLTPPKVSGNINLQQLQYEEPFGSPVSLALAGKRAADPTALWDWELSLTGPENIWIRNTDLNAEFFISDEFLVYRIDGQLIPLGVLSVMPGKGRFFLAGGTFDIKEGQILFENLDKIDPTLDLVVTTQIYEAQTDPSGSASSFPEDVELKITGPVSQPEIVTLGSSPEQVLEKIVLQSRTGVGSQIIQKYAYGLGVETFYLRPGWSSGLDLTQSELTVGGYLTRGLYWQYSSAFSTNPDLALQYRLNRNLFLQGNKDRSNLYHLGLKLRWEF